MASQNNPADVRPTGNGHKHFTVNTDNGRKLVKVPVERIRQFREKYPDAVRIAPGLVPAGDYRPGRPINGSTRQEAPLLWVGQSL